MRRSFTTLIASAAIAAAVWAAPAGRAAAATGEPVTDPKGDPAPCVAAAAANDADKIIAICGALIDNDKTARADRIKALIARGGAYDRKDLIDRAIGDYDTALRLDPTLADIFNARGELWRRKGDRPRALADFGAAIKLNPDHPTARGNYKSLAQELERLGALMAVYNKPSFNCSHRQTRGREGDLRQSRACQSRSRDQRGEHQGGPRSLKRQSARRPRPAARAGRFYRPPQCRVRPAGLRSAQGDAGAARPSAGGRAVLGGTILKSFGLELTPLRVTMAQEKFA